MFLGKIPQEVITWYETAKESERHFFRDEEEDEDFEQEKEDEGQKGDSLLSIPINLNYLHILTKKSFEYSKFLQVVESDIRTQVMIESINEKLPW